MNTRSFCRYPFTRSSLIACLMYAFVVLVLSACGGGGSSNSSSTHTDATVINPGIYKGAVLGKDWITVLLPTTGSATNFYALHYNATDPDIYSGTGQITGTSAASMSTVYLFPDNSKPVRTGTGTLTSLKDGIVSLALSFSSISIDHSAPSGYNFNSPASLSLAQGTWQGRWSYGQGYAENFTLNISATGDVSSSAMFQNDCQLTGSKLTVNAVDNQIYNLFNWTLKIPAATICSTTFGGQTLTGAGFITNSTVPGKAKTLYLVATTTDGRGISFKADR
jgi:hypothetical protein